jgi:high-affinity nickel-transport protein
VGTIEVMQLLPTELNWHGSFWNAMTALNINTAGFVIVGLFVLTWISAMLIWRYGNIEEKWSANLLPVNESQVA